MGKIPYDMAVEDLRRHGLTFEDLTEEEFAELIEEKKLDLKYGRWHRFDGFILRNIFDLEMRKQIKADNDEIPDELKNLV